jgi:hypothetical protein
MYGLVHVDGAMRKGVIPDKISNLARQGEEVKFLGHLDTVKLGGF